MKNLFEKNFWSKVGKKNNNECWNWNGFKNKKGYGHFQSNVGQLAHRFSYYIFYGELPVDMLVCHKCDNPSCVNPKHLFLGTQQDNLKDMRQKGRGVAVFAAGWTAASMGKIGGKNRAKNLSKKRRVEIARMGGLKRAENLTKIDAVV